MRLALSTMEQNSRSAHHAVLLVILAAALLYTAGLSPYLQGGGDDGYYLTVAKSLLEGKGFTSGHLVGSPPDTYHTPLFPVLLAGLYRFFPNDYVLLKLASLVPMPIAIYLVFRLALEYVSPGQATLISLLFALNPLVFRSTHDILTESLFTMLSMAALLCLKRYNEVPYYVGWPFWGSVLFVSAAYYTRSMGIPLLITAVFYFLVQKRWKKAVLVCCGIALLVAPWLVRQVLLGPPSELQLTYAPFYFAQDPTDPHSPTVTLTDLAIRVLKKGISYLVRELPALIAFPEFFDSVSLAYFQPIFLLIMALGLFLPMPVLVGYLRSAGQGRLLLALYVPLYFIPLVTCSFSSPRFLVPLSPLLLLFLVEAVMLLPMRRWSRLTIVVIIAITLISDVSELRRSHTLEIPTQGEWQLVEWMDENSPPDAVLMGGPIGILYLHTGRRGVPLWGRLSEEEILSRIQKYRVSHVVVYPERDYGKDIALAFTAKNLSELVNSNRSEFIPLHQTEEALIYLAKGEKTR
jgi:4-amino-4-deoxy-L-arabinose transferase-like glycosyltransferase